jgi:hypothetical protein
MLLTKSVLEEMPALESRIRGLGATARTGRRGAVVARDGIGSFGQGLPKILSAVRVAQRWSCQAAARRAEAGGERGAAPHRPQLAQ